MPNEGGPAPPYRRAASFRTPLVALAALAAGLVLGPWGLRHAGPASWFAPTAPVVTHDLVLEQVRAVAKLVASEATVRDVVAYENTYLGSTKRTLIVVTGRVSAGIDLSEGADVKVDDRAHTIAVSIPAARVLGAEVLSMRTYDERAGLWNPFRPADRDAINAQVRTQLLNAGAESGLVEHANRSAKATLETLLAREGYVVEVTVRGAVVRGG